MVIVEKLSKMIDEELDDARKYAQCALNEKDEHPEVADVFFKLSGEEMEHMKMLHDSAVELIEAYKKEKGEPPADMLAVYNYLHKQHIEKATDVRTMQRMYKDM